MANDVNVNRPLPGEGVVSFGEWMITILLTAIPIVNIVMLCVWAFGSGTNQNKANWAKASLVWLVIAVIGWLLFFGAMMTAILHMRG